MAFCSSHARPIIAVRFGPRPATSTSRPGSSSITRSVSTPKCPTIRPAVRGPIPLINPEPRYRSIPWTVAGNTVVYDSTSNCRPYRGCEPHRPTSRRLSPGCTPNSAPTTVTRSAPERSVTTRAIV
jgi:hypothetical protein